MYRYMAKRKAGEIPAILIGLLTAVFVTVEPLTQGKSWDDITHLSWGTILPPIVVGFLSHYLTVPRQEMTDVNKAYTAYIDTVTPAKELGREAGIDLRSSLEAPSTPVAGAVPAPAQTHTAATLPSPVAVSHAEMLDGMISSS
jgi:hypothetical protein